MNLAEVLESGPEVLEKLNVEEFFAPMLVLTRPPERTLKDPLKQALKTSGMGRVERNSKAAELNNIAKELGFDPTALFANMKGKRH